jgi:hypothetical protein
MTQTNNREETPAMAASKEVQPASSTDVVTIDGSLTSPMVLEYLRDPEAHPYVGNMKEDPDVVAARITAQTLGADSADALFGQRTVIHGKDVIGKAFLFTEDVSWLPSDVEGEGLPFFGVFMVADASGEHFPLTCGAKSVVLKLAKAHAEGWLPLWLKLTKSDKATPGGFYPLDIVSAQAPATANVKGGGAF